MYELYLCLRAMIWGGGASWGMEGDRLKTKAWNQVRSHIILQFLSSFLSGRTLLLFRKTQAKFVIGFFPSWNQRNRKRKSWLAISNAGISQAWLFIGRKPVFHGFLAFPSVNFKPVKMGARKHTNLVPWWERFFSCHVIPGAFVEANALNYWSPVLTQTHLLHRVHCSRSPTSLEWSMGHPFPWKIAGLPLNFLK